ncbi:MAG: hypothetical protein PHO57_02830 [Acidithiobacillus sp.]|jgi:hypothetical protein|nr:hypothetical protein [Acidithiobacillus sp.]
MLMRQDAKSLALFEAIAEKLKQTDPLPYLQRARDWAAHFSGQRPEDIWLAEWVVWLDAVLAQLAVPDLAAPEPESFAGMLAFMTSTSQHAIDMRSSSPFPGVLTTAERTNVLLTFDREWKKPTP